MTNALNVCLFAGRVSSDPQIQTINGGPNGSFEKARFSIAVDRALTQQQRDAAKNGDTSVKTCDFIDVEAVGNVVGSLVKPYIVKGKGVIVKTHYESFQYTDQQSGQTKYGHKFIIDDINFAPQDSKALQGNNGGNNNGGYQQQGNGYQQQGNQYNNNGYNNNNYNRNNGNNGYQQNNNSYQQNNQGFAMFDDAAQPF